MRLESMTHVADSIPSLASDASLRVSLRLRLLVRSGRSGSASAGLSRKLSPARFCMVNHDA